MKRYAREKKMLRAEGCVKIMQIEKVRASAMQKRKDFGDREEKGTLEEKKENEKTAVTKKGKAGEKMRVPQ